MLSVRFAEAVCNMQYSLSWAEYFGFSDVFVPLHEPVVQSKASVESLRFRLGEADRQVSKRKEVLD